MQNLILQVSQLDTPLGVMTVIADPTAVYLLAFTDQPDLPTIIEQLQQKQRATLIAGITPATLSLKQEIKTYFEGKLHPFMTPTALVGSPFQNTVWQQLQKIPAGQTRSYSEIAHAIGKPTAHRAVATANSTNPLSIIIPCHRVIYADGTLGGYAAGLSRKQWLIQHEKPCIE